MRRFYEAWEILAANSAVATVELEEGNSTVATAELLYADNEIDIFHTMQVSNVTEFPVEDFFKVPFTHHSIILSGTKATLERYYTKPMGVATYKTLDDMPEKLRKALPDVNKMIEILKNKG